MKRKQYHVKEKGSEGYIRLGNAIIELAAQDYRKNLAILKRNPYEQKAKDEIERIEKFFHSRLYGVITTIEPNILIKGIREEY